MDDFRKCVVGSFDDEVEALVRYGHDCCARIDDRIHECCERIKDAHNVEVDAYKIALGWKQEQDTLVTYDVLGNERHKVVCELGKLRFRGEGIGYDGGVPPVMNVEDVTNLLGAICDLTDDWPSSLAKVRDTLVHLLGADDSDCRADSQGGVLTPITGELRGRMGTLGWYDEDGNIVCTTGDEPMSEMACLVINSKTFGELCDAIDAIHANLERENEELRQRTMYPAKSECINTLEREVRRLTAECKTQRNNFDQATSARAHWEELYEQSLRHVRDLERENDSLKVELDRVLGEQDEREHHAWAPESHYMMLPKDADGVPVHVGDVMEWCDSGETLVVEGIGIDVLFYIDGENAEWTAARNKRHRTPDSWERIIADAAATRCDFDDLVARCKALAGDPE